MKNGTHEHSDHEHEQGHCHQPHSAPESAAGNIDGVMAAAHGDAAIVVDKPFTDPVCGMRVADQPDRRIEYDGHVYHFCSVKCMDKFRASPSAYVGEERQVASTSAPAGTIYTCPMHPQIQQPGPGTCPICGMALEPMMPSLEEDESPELGCVSKCSEPIEGADQVDGS